MSPGGLDSSTVEPNPTFPARLIEDTIRRAKSWYGLATAYLLAVVAFLVACKQLGASVSGRAPYVLILLLAVPLLLTFGFQAIPDFIDHRRRKQLAVSTGELKPGYFRLAPRQQGEGFSRSDKKHEEVFEWLCDASTSVLFVTGQSGSGKSSLLDAWVIPRLRQDLATEVIKLRAYQEPLEALASRLREPDLAGKHTPEQVLDIRTMLERAAARIKPRRLLIVFDQFEEYVMFREELHADKLEDLLESAVINPINEHFFSVRTSKRLHRTDGKPSHSETSPR
jgi:hypothetical protein